MNVLITREDQSVVATVRGEIDADNCAAFGADILDGTDQAGRVVVDLSELTFIDSSGISELLRLSETVTGRGQDFELRHPSPAVHRVLEITGLLAHFGLS
ncbi:MAG: STAS domain-containing protein [Actinomycetota bacterium]